MQDDKKNTRLLKKQHQITKNLKIANTQCWRGYDETGTSQTDDKIVNSYVFGIAIWQYILQVLKYTH